MLMRGEKIRWQRWYKVTGRAVLLVLVVMLVMLSVWHIASADTTTLNPMGDTATIALTPSTGTTHYNLVNDSSDTTHVSSDSNNYDTDLYELDDVSGVLTNRGKINSVTVYMRAQALDTATEVSARAVISIGGTPYPHADEHMLTLIWADYSGTWNTNPNSGSEWTWTNINDLQAGVELKRSGGSIKDSQCSEVWVVVDYTVPTLESYDDAVQTSVWGTVGAPYTVDTPTVYMYSENLIASHSYHVVYYDGSNGGTGGIKIESQGLTSTAGNILSSSYLLSSKPATSGTWHAVVFDDDFVLEGDIPTNYNDCATSAGYVLADDLVIYSSAIPEFPTVLAAIGVAGLCFAIYYWMRKRVCGVCGVEL